MTDDAGNDAVYKALGIVPSNVSSRSLNQSISGSIQKWLLLLSSSPVRTVASAKES